jgi:RNA polymerase sigma factor (sigma-70 family)
LAFIRNISSHASSDEQLLAQYRASGDLNTLATLYNRYMDLVLAVCVRYLEDQEAAKDAVMDIFGELIHKLSNHELSNFRSWLYTVAKNHCLMKLRSRRVGKLLSIDEEHVQSEDNLHQQENMMDKERQLVIMEGCMEKLPMEQKTVIDLFYLQQKCYNDIAASTGFEWNKVRSLVQNGRRNLKICMEKSLSGTKEKMT